MTEPLTAGSICTGYGGLELALTLAGVPHQLAWVAEISDPACRVLTERFPGVPNIGDINHVNPEPVDLITAGFPCQDISNAGRRAGLDGDRSGLWWRIAEVIGNIRPRYVLLENVAAISTLGGTAVVGSLTAMRYDCRWVTVRASDIGACHHRARWFCLACDTESDTGWVFNRERSEAIADSVSGRREGGARAEGRGPRRRTATTGSGEDLLGTPRAADGMGHPLRDPANIGDPRGRLEDQIALLPTPTASQSGGTAEQHLQRKQAGKMNRSNPTVTDLGLLLQQPNVDFGKYQAAIDCHSAVFGRRPPEPTVEGRLNPVFVEWMMGLPQGWVTSVDMKRAEALRTLGNGVVPQQAATAIKRMADYPQRKDGSFSPSTLGTHRAEG